MNNKNSKYTLQFIDSKGNIDSTWNSLKDFPWGEYTISLKSRQALSKIELIQSCVSHSNVRSFSCSEVYKPYVVDNDGDSQPGYVNEFFYGANYKSSELGEPINTEAINDRVSGADHDINKNYGSELGGQDGGNYDKSGNSAHYQSNFMEYIREQERKYGTVAAYLACQTQVDRYNQRVGTKEGVPAEKDLTKRDWYKTTALHFKKKIDAVRLYAEIGKSCELCESYVPMAEEFYDLISPELYLTDRVESCKLTYTPLSEIHKELNTNG